MNQIMEGNKSGKSEGKQAGEQIGMWRRRQWVINQELREHKCLKRRSRSVVPLSSPQKQIKSHWSEIVMDSSLIEGSR